MNLTIVKRLLIPLAATAALVVAMEFAAPQEEMEPGRELRQTFLDASAADRRLAPTPEYPKVFAVAMDWPVDDQFATVAAVADGTASLFTTAPFGVLGGPPKPTANQAARRFVTAAQSHFDRATPATAFPYPAATAVRFYLVGYDGVRYLEAPLDAVQDATAPLSPLYQAAQDVLTELQQASAPRQ